jgi:ribosomal protein S12 methylthiotransferase accessory factor
MEIKRNKFKDDSPENTILKIRGILKEIDIVVYETNWDKINNHCYSVRIEIDGLNGVGVNGKGISRSYALASAYGELMERLQNRHVVPRVYGMLPKEKFSFPDEVEVDSKVILIKSNILKHLLTDFETKPKEVEELFNDFPSLSLCVPFYNVNSDKLELIPSRLLNFSIGTNGMCAGNSPEEAIIHGICELLERHAIKEIVFNEISLPDIPLEKVAHFPIYETIQQIKTYGYNVIIKDCTLGGRFPVVGVLIINKAGTRYNFHHGSDLVFEIALERCFTEMFQGYSMKNFNASMQPIEWDTHSYDLKSKIKFVEGLSKSGDGQFPNSIFSRSDQPFYIEYPFLNNLQNNKEGLKHITSLLLKENYQLFIRDLSFLNFPAYKIYIPGISEIYLNDLESIKNQFKSALATKSILNITKSDLKSLENLNEVLEKEVDGIFGHSVLFKKMSINLSESNELRTLSCRHLLTVLNYNLNDYKKSFNYLKDLIKNERIDQYSNANYYLCALAFLKYKVQNVSDEKISEMLASVYSIDLVTEVIADLSKGMEAFQILGLPTCPNCHTCPVSSTCNHNIYSKINDALIEKMKINWINQDSINKYFNN